MYIHYSYEIFYERTTKSWYYYYYYLQYLYSALSNYSQYLKAYRPSELNFLFILKVANIRRFILIKCSEQKARFKKSVIMS
jgi:hypothetical protein